jgi:hypothetical protein
MLAQEVSNYCFRTILRHTKCPGSQQIDQEPEFENTGVRRTRKRGRPVRTQIQRREAVSDQIPSFLQFSLYHRCKRDLHLRLLRDWYANFLVVAALLSIRV